MQSVVSTSLFDSQPRSFQNKFRRCRELLRYVKRASNINILVTKIGSNTVPAIQDLLSDLASHKSWKDVAIEKMFVYDMAKATAHVMDLLANDSGAVAAVLKGNAACEIVEKLCCETRRLLSRSDPDSNEVHPVMHKRQQEQMDAQFQIDASGLSTSLAMYSQKVAVVLSRLAAETVQHLQHLQHVQQQQQQLLPASAQQTKEQKQHFYNTQRDCYLKMHCHAARHAHDILGLCSSLASLALPSATSTTLQSFFLLRIIKFTATAVPLLSKGLLLPACRTGTSSSSSSSKCSAVISAALQDQFSELSQLLGRITTVVSGLSGMLSLLIQKELVLSAACHTTASVDFEQLPEQQQQLLMTEQLPELLLFLLATQAAGLQAKCSNEASTAAAATTAATGRNLGGVASYAQQSQSQQQQCSSKQRVHWNSHKALLAALGVSSQLQQDGDNQFHRASCLDVIWVLRSVIEQRMLTVLSHRNSSSDQQMQPSTLPVKSGNAAMEIIPANSIHPTVKVLIDIMLLLPDDDDYLMICAVSLDLVMLLLRISAAAVRATMADTRMGQSADNQATVSALLETDWPVIPAAMAAGLLHPVVQLLPHVVIRALKKTESHHHHHQQQQQQQLNPQQACTPIRPSRAFGQASLLHHYSNLLMTVCQSVEPRHIAAALKPDPVMPLVAIEAVIREQMQAAVGDSARTHEDGDCFLSNLQSQQQQSQSRPPLAAAAVAAAVMLNLDTAYLKRTNSGNIIVSNSSGIYDEHGQQQQQQQQPPADPDSTPACSLMIPVSSSSGSQITNLQSAGSYKAGEQPDGSHSGGSYGQDDQISVLLLPFITKFICAVRDFVQNQQITSRQSQSSNLQCSQRGLDDESASSVTDMPVRVFNLTVTACKVGSLAAQQWRRLQATVKTAPVRASASAAASEAAAAAPAAAPAADTQAGPGADAGSQVMHWCAAGAPAIVGIATTIRDVITGTANHHSRCHTSSTTGNQGLGGVRGSSEESTIANNTFLGLRDLPHTMLLKALAAVAEYLQAVSAAAAADLEQQAGCSLSRLTFVFTGHGGVRHDVARGLQLSELLAAVLGLLSGLSHLSVLETAPHPTARQLSGCDTESAVERQQPVEDQQCCIDHCVALQPDGTTQQQQQQRDHPLQQLRHLQATGNNIQAALLRLNGVPVAAVSGIWQKTASACSDVQHCSGVPGAATADEATATVLATSEVSRAGVDPSSNVDDAEWHGRALPANLDQNSGNDCVKAATVQQNLSLFSKQLKIFTLSALSEFPVPFCCNNPSCLNLSKLSEYQLVSGKACVCGGCKVARYCSRECQTKHWKMHKPVCQWCSTG